MVAIVSDSAPEDHKGQKAKKDGNYCWRGGVAHGVFLLSWFRACALLISWGNWCCEQLISVTGIILLFERMGGHISAGDFISFESNFCEFYEEPLFEPTYRLYV